MQTKQFWSFSNFRWILVRSGIDGHFESMSESVGQIMVPTVAKIIMKSRENKISKFLI